MAVRTPSTGPDNAHPARPTYKVRSSRDLRGLMQLYESSYQRLLRLLPEWPLPFDRAVSTTEYDRPLIAESVEVCPYTSTLRLTYLYEEDRQPDLLIKVYHDAQLAEALSVGEYHRCELLRDFDLSVDSAVNSLWPANLLMDKWLGFLLQQGHGFALADRPRMSEVAV